MQDNLAAARALIWILTIIAALFLGYVLVHLRAWLYSFEGLA